MRHDSDDSRFRTLQALRVKGAATPADVERISGTDAADAVLAELERAGLATSRPAGGTAYFALTPEGHEQLSAALTGRMDGDARGELDRVYENRFLPVNVTFKRLCAEFQEDAERFELVEQAVDVHEEIGAVLEAAARADRRFVRYAERLGRAMDAFQDGDRDALTAPVGESYHNIWFELHEDLLVTLGRSRADEAA